MLLCLLLSRPNAIRAHLACYQHVRTEVCICACTGREGPNAATRPISEHYTETHISMHGRWAGAKGVEWAGLGYEMGRSRVRGWHLDVEVVALALRAAVRDHHGHRSRVGVLVAAPLRTRMLPVLIACMSNRKLTEHWQLLEAGRKRRNIDAQTDGYPGLYCTQCAGHSLWHQSQ